MNSIRKAVAFCNARALELLLVFSVLSLVGQLAWPLLMRWRNLPTPGAIGVDQFKSPSLADEYLVYLPEDYGGDKKRPLVIFLHGSGARAIEPSRIRNVPPLRLRLPAIVAVPICRPPSSWQPDAVASFAQNVAARYRVDLNQIYLIGHSMGGYGVVHTAAAHPKLFAAVVPISGGNRTARLTELRDSPVWAFHGAKDEVVPVTESQRMIEAIRDAGGRPRLTVLPDAGHGICGEVCEREDLWQWLFAQRLAN